jgi:TrmH family RNA methyltransferase
MLTKAEIVRLRSLHDKKQRESLGLFVVEGEKVVSELLLSGFPFIEVYATPDWTPPAIPPVGNRLHAVSPAEMGRISHFPTPSAVLAVGRVDRPALDPAVLDHGLTLVLDGIQDAGNLGTLLRVADWFALARVLCSPDCVDAYNQKVINASMGSFSRVPLFTAPLGDALRQVRVPILGCDLEGTAVHTAPPLTDAGLVIGSEGRGISATVRERLSGRVTIPRYGHAESLNAGIAAAIVCDNLRRLSPPPRPS